VALRPESAEVLARVRDAAWAVALPLGAIVGGTVAAMVLAHQVQTGGIWTPALLAPDPRRLMSGPGRDPAARAWRGIWGLLRAIAVVAVAAWALGADLPALASLARLEPGPMARAAGSTLTGFAYAVGLVLLGLGVLDFALAYRRVEALLRQTPDEQREEQRTVDGDPELRARRLRVARERLRDPSAGLRGASLVLVGPAGLTVLLGGDPPPGRLNVLLVARGLAAASLRRAAERAGLPRADSPALARWFAEAQARRAHPPGALPPSLAAELAGLWPAKNRD
jgi:flagellar biosynthesis protein FlhB